MVEPVTGTDILRACALRRVKKVRYAALAQDLGITGNHFVDFAEGRRDLPVEKLQLLCKEFYPNGARLDVERDLLVTGNQEAKVFATAMPEPCKRTEFKPVPFTGLRFELGEPPKPKTSRPGWSGRWL